MAKSRNSEIIIMLKKKSNYHNMMLYDKCMTQKYVIVEYDYLVAYT